MGLSCRKFVLALAMLAAGCTGAVKGGTLPVPLPPFHQLPDPTPPPFAYDGHVKDMGFWLDSSKATAPFTTFVTLAIDSDADPAEWASLIDLADSRQIVWFVSPFYYTHTARSLNGYVYRDDFPGNWARIATVIGQHLDRTRAIWLADEPDSVAWGDMVPGGPYDPNLYNPDLARAAAIIHASFPNVKVGYNVAGGWHGDIQLKVADGIDLIGQEAYGTDALARIQLLETQTTVPIWLLAPAFANGDPMVTDPIIAQRVRDLWTWSQHDARVIGWYPFVNCCDDTTTGSKDFYTPSGGHIPLTRQALVDAGTAIRGPQFGGTFILLH